MGYIDYYHTKCSKDTARLAQCAQGIDPYAFIGIPLSDKTYSKAKMMHTEPLENIKSLFYRQLITISFFILVCRHLFSPQEKEQSFP
jgi:hypothetical protein